MTFTPHRTLRLGALLVGLLSLAGGAAAQTDPFAAARTRFLEAYAAVKAGAQSPEQPGDADLKTYPLYSYLQAARLQRALAAATGPADPADTHAAEFLQYYQDEPVAAGVRRSWLNSLAERQQWTTFLVQYRENSADAVLKCHALNARVQVQPDTAAGPIAAHYLSAEQLPPACEPVFAWARAQGIVTPALIEQRVRLVLAKGDARFARTLARSLPEAQAAPLMQWASLLEQPRREIDALIATPARAVESQALIDGWNRLVRSDLDYARNRYDALVKARKLDAASASSLALGLALRLSWNRHPATLDYFRRVRAADMDDVAHEWKARAALWSGDWAGVADTINAMPEALRETARWRYWAGRAAAQKGDHDAARRLYVSVLGFDNYYSAMSAARMEQAFTPNPVPVATDEVELKRIAALPAFVRARELLLAGMRGEAFTEWQAAVRNLGAESQRQAVHLGMRWGWYDVSIATATQQRIFEDYSLLYPRPYDSVVQAASKLSGLPTELVYGVMRQESLYRSDAVSSAGAMGLLQLLPATARSTAKRWKRSEPARADLLNPAVNAPLGAAHLKELQDRFGGQIPIALAGYNAGPNAALRWLPAAPLETDIWIENIPYNETRTYVQRILWHTLVFSWLESGQPQTTGHWLTQVSLADAGKS